jgi:hypothetical protein
MKRRQEKESRKGSKEIKNRKIGTTIKQEK